MTVMTQDIEQELLRAVRRLSATRAAEVLDFAHFLVTRDPAPTNVASRHLANGRVRSSKSAWNSTPMNASTPKSWNDIVGATLPCAKAGLSTRTPTKLPCPGESANNMATSPC